MREKYQSITVELLKNKNLSLEIYNTRFVYGLINARAAQIEEPNPNEGAEAGDGEQTYYQGPRRPKSHFSFKGIDSLNALELLARKCNGEEVVQDTAFKSSQDEAKSVHGLSYGQPGIDAWIFNNYGFSVQNNPNSKNLIAKMTLYPFGFKSLIVSQHEVESVAEAIDFYQNHIVDSSLLQTLKIGVTLDKAIRHELKWKDANISGNNIIETLGKRSQIIDYYNHALEVFEGFNIPMEAKNGIIIGAMLRTLYGQKDQ